MKIERQVRFQVELGFSRIRPMSLEGILQKRFDFVNTKKAQEDLHRILDQQLSNQSGPFPPVCVRNHGYFNHKGRSIWTKKHRP